MMPHRVPVAGDGEDHRTFSFDRDLQDPRKEEVLLPVETPFPFLRVLETVVPDGGRGEPRRPGGLDEEGRHALVGFDPETVFDPFRPIRGERVFVGELVIPPEGEERFQAEDAALRTPLQVVTDKKDSLPAGHQNRFLYGGPARPADETGAAIEDKLPQYVFLGRWNFYCTLLAPVPV